MKKNLLILILITLSLSTLQAKAGILKFGVKGGISTQNIDFKDKLKFESHAFDMNNKTGYHVGIMSRINLLFFHIQPELLYNINRYDIKLISTGNMSGRDYSTKIQNSSFQVPVLLGFKFLFLRANAGPVFNITSSTKSSEKWLDTEHFKSSISYCAGIGADILKFTVDLRYNGQFSSSKQDLIFENGSSVTGINTRDGFYTLSLGYFF